MEEDRPAVVALLLGLEDDRAEVEQRPPKRSHEPDLEPMGPGREGDFPGREHAVGRPRVGPAGSLHLAPEQDAVDADFVGVTRRIRGTGVGRLTCNRQKTWSLVLLQ
jgi:hypothetical protein